MANDDFALNGAKVRSRWVRHTDPTLGFRVEIEGVSVAYLSDHGPGTVPDDPDDYVPDDVLELCDGVDLLIHDAQHTAEEYEIKRTWGHCTIEYAIHVAKEAGARQLALFHHCPSHGDESLDTILRDARESRRGSTARRCSRPPTVCATSSARRTADRGASVPDELLVPDDKRFRSVLGHFATGVTIITAMDGEEPVGMAANSFTSLSLDPPLILFCVAHASSTWPRSRPRACSR